MSAGSPAANAQVAPPRRKLCPEYSWLFNPALPSSLWRRLTNSLCIYICIPPGVGKENKGPDCGTPTLRQSKFVTAATGQSGSDDISGNVNLSYLSLYWIVLDQDTVST